MELCVDNYATLYVLVNGVHGTFEDMHKNNPKPLIWIYFHNLQIGTNTSIKNSYIYKQFPTIVKNGH